MSDELLMYILIFIRYALPLLVLQFLFATLLKKRNKYCLRLILSSLGYVGISILLNYYDNYITLFDWFHLNFFFIFLLSMLVIYICYDVKARELIFYSTLSYTVQHSTDNIILFFYTVFNSFYSFGWFFSFSIYICIPIIADIIVYFTFIKRFKKAGGIKVKNQFIFLISIISIIIVYVVSMYRYAYESSSFNTSYFYDMVLCIFILSISLNVVEKTNLKLEKVILNSLLHNKEAQFNQTKNNIDLINMKIHDFKKLIDTYNYSNDQNTQKEIIKEIENQVELYNCSIKTGNISLDVILTDKGLQAQKNDINFVAMVDGKLLSFMKDVDLYSLFENALDNAISSLSKEEKENRYLNVLVKQIGAVILISIENYCSQDISFNDGLPITKNDKNYHGFGTKSIKYICEKYDGIVNFEYKDNLFKLNITFLENDIKK